MLTDRFSCRSVQTEDTIGLVECSKTRAQGYLSAGPPGLQRTVAASCSQTPVIFLTSPSGWYQNFDLNILRLTFKFTKGCPALGLNRCRTFP